MAAMTTEQTGPALPPEGASIRPRQLRRRTTDRVIGGVAGGVADYLNVDPLLPRVGFAGLMVFGGAGLVLYVVAWLLMPAQGRHDSIAQSWIAPLSERLGTRGTALLIVASVILAGLWVMGQSQACYEDLENPGNVYCRSTGFDWLPLQEPSDQRNALIAVAVITAGVLVLRWREGFNQPGAAPGAGVAQAAAPSAGLTATTAPGAVAAAAAETAPWTPGLFTAASGAAWPAATPRPRSPLGWFVVAAALVAIGLSGIVDAASGLDVGLAQYFGAAILVLGVGLVVGAWWGRARLLILLALLLLPVAATAAFIPVPLEGGVAEQAFEPTTVGELRPEYRLTGGDMRIDLTGLRSSGDPITLDASVGVGRLVVVIPDGARLALDARVSGGRLSLFGNRQTGTGLADRIERPGGSGPDLVLRLEAGLGEVRVESASSGG